jgi:hypothetical protein
VQASSTGSSATASSVFVYIDTYKVFASANSTPGVALFGSSARIAFYSIGEAVNLAALGTRVTTLQAAIAAALA